MIFLFRFLLFFAACSCVGLYVSLWLYPLSVRGAFDKGQWICQILLYWMKCRLAFCYC